MKRTGLFIIMTFCLAALPHVALPQNNAGVRWLENLRMESQLCINFFTGPDADLFAPSVGGFGSGLLDVFGMRHSVDLVCLGSPKAYVSLGAGFSVFKYRLANHPVPGETQGGAVIWEPDPDTTHNYVDTFFGYGKSKIITTSFFFPLNLNLDIGRKIILTAGGYIDLNLSARYKIKYLESGEKVRELIRSADFRKLGPSTVKFGLNASLRYRNFPYGLSAAYCLTPFFRPGMGPDIHETRVTVTYSFRPTRDLADPSK